MKNNPVAESDKLPVWCAVRTKPGGEYLACSEMERVGITSYLPQFRREYRHHRSKRWITRHFPLFLGYIFTPLDGLDRNALNDCDGLTRDGVLRDHLGAPMKISGMTIKAIRENEEKGLFDQMKQHGRRLKPGQPVIVTKGPFAGIEAVISSVQDRTNVGLLLTMFGRQTSVKGSLDMIELA